MKYFKFWVKESFNIRVDQVQQSISILSGSNISKEDASAKAANQSKQIESRIASGKIKETYEASIKEHVAEVIDEQNIVTVCRYGAKVLNSTQYTFFDLDDYPHDLWDIFKPVRKLPKKERIVYKFLEKIKKHPELGSDFRIYETTKGIRVIGKKYLNPADRGYQSLMRKVAVDWLYMQLSKKQNCFRARLTPKPYRMQAKTIKVRSPLDCETPEYIAWEKSYQSASQRYAVVKHLKSIGSDFANEPVIKMHDQTCNAHNNLTLA